ncbi:MAG: hypothetical protein ACUVXA_06190 [Candidatus Jordarchaeum sp.]|uniref:hypothetical protein n=1 Tax=Candidatus Jordarchaeum sp. TaxID=2823881 RepID=UPI00404A59F5
MAKYKGYAPGSEFIAYPTLEREDIEYDFFRKESASLGESLVENKRGRIVIRWEFEFYKNFLKAVEKVYGDIGANNVETAVRAAAEEWVKKVSDK